VSLLVLEHDALNNSKIALQVSCVIVPRHAPLVSRKDAFEHLERAVFVFVHKTTDIVDPCAHTNRAKWFQRRRYAFDWNTSFGTLYCGMINECISCLDTYTWGDEDLPYSTRCDIECPNHADDECLERPVFSGDVDSSPRKSALLPLCAIVLGLSSEKYYAPIVSAKAVLGKAANVETLPLMPQSLAKWGSWRLTF
jgi:hypothetical protein